MNDSAAVWVFSGEGGRFPSGVFTALDVAQEWIRMHKLSGVLTCYPLNHCVYDWAVSGGYFEPKKEHETSPEFIQGFSCAAQEHYHYEHGEVD